MYSDVFNALLNELGRLIKIPSLEADETGCCTVEYPALGLKIEMSTDKNNTFLQILCILGEVPPGRYREEVLHEALRANDLPIPRYGNFGYNMGNNHLVLWDNLTLNKIQAADLAEYLVRFLNKANEVKEALIQNRVPSLVARASIRTSGIFGLR